MVPVGDSLWKLMQWDHKLGRISGLIGECKKVKGYERFHALSHTEIVWFESSDKHNWGAKDAALLESTALKADQSLDKNYYIFM